MLEKAPEGKIWVCPACGRTQKDKMEFRDVSCVMNSVLCKDRKEEIEGEMRWVYAPEE